MLAKKLKKSPWQVSSVTSWKMFEKHKNHCIYNKVSLIIILWLSCAVLQGTTEIKSCLFVKESKCQKNLELSWKCQRKMFGFTAHANLEFVNYIILFSSRCQIVRLRSHFLFGSVNMLLSPSTNQIQNLADFDDSLELNKLVAMTNPL